MMKSHDEVTQEIFKRRDMYFKKKRDMTKKALAVGIPLCLCVVIFGGIGINNLFTEGKLKSDLTATASENNKYVQSALETDDKRDKVPETTKSWETVEGFDYKATVPETTEASKRQNHSKTHTSDSMYINGVSNSQTKPDTNKTEPETTQPATEAGNADATSQTNSDDTADSQTAPTYNSPMPAEKPSQSDSIAADSCVSSNGFIDLDSVKSVKIVREVQETEIQKKTYQDLTEKLYNSFFYANYKGKPDKYSEEKLSNAEKVKLVWKLNDGTKMVTLYYRGYCIKDLYGNIRMLTSSSITELNKIIKRIENV